MFHLGNCMSKASAEGEDGAGEGKNESFSWPEWSDGRGWGRRRARVCFLARLQRATDTNQPRNFELCLSGSG